MILRVFEALAPEAGRSLGAVANLLDALDHESVVTVRDYTPTVAGATLVVDAGGSPLRALAPTDVPASVAQACSTVSYLHDRGVYLGGVSYHDIEVDDFGVPVFVDPTRWRPLAAATQERSDVAAMGRLLAGLLGTSPTAPIGWMGRLSESDRRRRAAAGLGRGAESGRISTAAELGRRLAQIVEDRPQTPHALPGVVTPRVRRRAAAESTSTERIAASSRRSLPRIVTFEPLKS